MNKIFAPFLPPWAETGLQPAFYDVESGTVLQQTARMYDKVNQLIRLFNEFSESVSTEINAFEKDVNDVVEEYIEKFTELKDFVEDYFENLDVQEEINNKLDEMADDGTLADIVAAYIQLRGILAYSTVSDMKNATNLTNGSFCETYGFYTKGDGGSAKYIIRPVTNDDTIDDATIISITSDPSNTLIAELIQQDEMNVRQFGVVGDGTTDDADRIQIAINFCEDKILHFGNFTYRISKPLSASDIKIEGDNAIIKVLAGFAGNYMLIPHNKLTMKNIKFDADGRVKSCIGESEDSTYLEIDNGDFTGTSRDVIEGDFAMNSAVYACAKECNIQNTTVHDNLSHGLRLFAKVAHSVANVENCQFINNGSHEEGSEVIAGGLVHYGGGANGLLYDKATISNCYAIGNANTGIAGHGINNIVIDSCVCNDNGEHGICLMDGKNGVISNCICDNNFRYGIRIQGDYSSTAESYHGYKNCIITGNLIIGSGFDIDEDIDTIQVSDNIVKYKETGIADPIRGLRLGRYANATHPVKHGIFVNNSFYGFQVFPIQSTIPLDNTNTFDNYVNGEETKYYYFEKEYLKSSTCSTLDYGTSDNINTNPTSLTGWNTVGSATIAGNVITKGSNQFVAYKDLTISTTPRFVSILAKVSEYDDDAAFGIGIRFRNRSNTLCSGDYYQIMPIYGRTLEGICIDLSKVESLVTSDIAKLELCIYLNKGSVKVDYLYCAFSDELPIMANELV